MCMHGSGARVVQVERELPQFKLRASLILERRYNVLKWTVMPPFTLTQLAQLNAIWFGKNVKIP